jgi:hypothetical protein
MNDDLNGTIRTGWRLAAIQHTPGAVATVDLPVDTDTGPAALGLDDRGDHHLLLPITERHPDVEDDRSAHVQVRSRYLVIGGRRHRYVDVVCHRPDLADVFDEMIIAVLHGIAETPDQGGSVAIRVLQEWRELLRSRGGLLNEHRLRGLIGELSVLETLAGTRPIGDVERIWNGPDLLPHDYTIGKRRIEVKTVGVLDSVVTIHGLDQLYPAPALEIQLVLLRLEADSGGRSLPDMVDSVLNLVRDRIGLRRQLAKVGYVEADADRYRERRYTTAGMHVWTIDAGFPRIDRDSLNPGISSRIVRVEYDLDLSDVLHLAATGREAVRLIRAGVAG